ncbi:MAG TPA: hypothetical protein VFI92_09625 [Steroidobacteraceae bacterium]|nr:hypothetical protein [Steroidobacteraceae bacterium]
MNWADAMKENADLASREAVSTDEIMMSRNTSTSWEPHEVWLTRIKLPRDRALRQIEEPAAQ